MKGVCHRCDIHTTVYAIEVGFQLVGDDNTELLICGDCIKTVGADKLLDQLLD